jgi:hypothetical protein
MKSISKIKVDYVASVHSFIDILEEGVRFFQNLYQEKKGCPMKDIFEALSKYFPVFPSDMNKLMEE